MRGLYVCVFEGNEGEIMEHFHDGHATSGFGETCMSTDLIRLQYPSIPTD
jgi:hypothetical protein